MLLLKLGVCPKLLFHDNSIQVFNFINGKTFDSNDIKNNLEDITKLIKKVHIKIPDQLSWSICNFLGFLCNKKL